MSDSLWQQAGGAPVVRRVCDRMVASMRQDVMIGAFFRRTDMARLAQREYEHAAALLGGPVSYRGRPLGAAHRRLALRRGHFDRRLTLLAEAMVACGVAPSVKVAWLAHQRRLEAEVGGQENC